jgi:hypothetical protein
VSRKTLLVTAPDAGIVRQDRRRAQRLTSGSYPYLIVSRTVDILTFALDGVVFLVLVTFQ